jgi:hypothetical protein
MSASEISSTIGGIAADFGIDDADLERRKSFFCLDEQDAIALKALHEPFTRDLQQRFTDAFYTHLQRFDETRELLRDDATVARLKRNQSAYFNRLTAGDYGSDYVQDRLRVGVAHERLGLSPHWYIGAYCQYLSGLLPEVWTLLGDRPERFIAAWQALQKLVLFDISLAMETYIHAACGRIQAEHERSEQARREAHGHAERLQRQAFEIQRLAAMAGLPSTAITARFIGVKSLHENNPDLFETLSGRYEQLLDAAVEDAKYKTEPKPDTDLRGFAERLGILKAGPRDVVEIHSLVLKKKLAESSSLSQFYLEEGRLMAFEILGYLTSFYRNYYLRPRESAGGGEVAHATHGAEMQ